MLIRGIRLAMAFCLVGISAGGIGWVCWRAQSPIRDARDDWHPPGTRAAEFGLPEDTLVELEEWRKIEDFDQKIAQFKTVFWEPADTTSLRKLIRETELAKGKRILEIGTGTGLVSLACLVADAQHVVATDVNPSAVANAIYNAEVLQVGDRLTTRLVQVKERGAYSVIGEHERFDLIISNPPWEDQKPKEYAEFALYDEDFVLLESLIKGLPDHLKPGGAAMLAYGCKTAIRVLIKMANDEGFEVRVLDERSLDELDELFLPGMLIEVKLPLESGT